MEQTISHLQHAIREQIKAVSADIEAMQHHLNEAKRIRLSLINADTIVNNFVRLGRLGPKSGKVVGPFGLTKDGDQ